MSQTLKIALPMAGFGSRLRPHTWSKPKPLLSLAGKTVLDYCLAQFNTVPESYDVEFIFIHGSQGDQIRAYMDEKHPAKSVQYVLQAVMLGQSDALYQARQYLKGPMIMAFSDTLTEIDFSFLKNERADGVAVVKRVPDPRRFGAALLDEQGKVKRLVEKPQDISQNLVVVGFYYFRSGEELIDAIEEQMRRGIILKGEYFLTDAINILIERGWHFRVEEVETWLDAGTPDAMFETNRYLLEHGNDNTSQVVGTDVHLIPPVFIHDSAQIHNSVIGPYVSVDAECKIENCILSDVIIGSQTHISHQILQNSLVGSHVTLEGHSLRVNIGDNAWVKK